MKKIKFMDTSFRDGFQSCYGARVKTEDFTPILKAAVEAGNDNFEIGGDSLIKLYIQRHSQLLYVWKIYI